MWIGPNNDQIWLPMDQTSDSEQCSNQLQLDLILLVKFACELGQIMTRYDLLGARRVILIFVKFSFLIKFYIALGRKMVFAIQKANLVDIQNSRFRWYSFVLEGTQNRLVLSWSIFLVLVGANNEQIWLPRGDEWFGAMFEKGNIFLSQFIIFLHWNKTYTWCMKCIIIKYVYYSMTKFISECTVSPRGHLFYVDFLFFIFTSHRGENIPTAVRSISTRWEVFPPRWKHSHHGENIPTAVCFHLGGNTYHRGGNVLTAVGMFPPRWECGNIPTAVRSKNKK